MSSRIFRKLLINIPPSINSGSRRKREYLRKIQPWLDSIDFVGFSKTDKLYGKIFYFNPETYTVRDIHNIIKPIFDMLQGYVYDNDYQILFFEGIRLDMPKKNSGFEIELDYDATPDLHKVEEETCCLIEVGSLPPTESAVNVIWL
ncbi:MAG: hypothetical protein DRR19_21530 [Candidatus Parabeggiatoa sp. nov. 1]|nr:MAG: hypothetical protein DRR19_21530 [Gammaproteobacteria bacterium]